jgi:hypothetical protein
VYNKDIEVSSVNLKKYQLKTKIIHSIAYPFFINLIIAFGTSEVAFVFWREFLPANIALTDFLFILFVFSGAFRRAE